MKNAEAQARKAQLDLQRVENLVADSSLSLRERDASRASASQAVANIAQRIPVRVHIDHDNALYRLLRPGMSVEVDIDTDSSPAVQERAQVDPDTTPASPDGASTAPDSTPAVSGAAEGVKH